MTLRIPLRVLAGAIGDRERLADATPMTLPSDAPDWFGASPDCPIRRPDDLQPAPRLLIREPDVAAPYQNALMLRSALDDASLHFRIRHAIRRELDVTLPGTLLRVAGVGILLTGPAGSGKSETALALIERGHALIADDAVRVRAGTHDALEGSAPELLRGRLCVRGLGMLDIARQYPERTAASTTVDLIVDLTTAANAAGDSDPLHGNWRVRGLLGERRPALTLGAHRPLPLLLEQAARLLSQRQAGFDPATVFMAAQREALQCGW